MNKVNTKGGNNQNIIKNFIYANIREDLPDIMIFLMMCRNCGVKINKLYFIHKKHYW